MFGGVRFSPRTASAKPPSVVSTTDGSEGTRAGSRRRIGFLPGDAPHSMRNAVAQEADRAVLAGRRRWTIAGHTDNQGGADYNLKLSLARAHSS